MRRIASLTPIPTALTSLPAGGARKLSACVLTAALLATVPALPDSATLKAQDFSECIYCADEPGPEHWTWWFIVTRSGYGPGDGIHHGENRSGFCLYVHGICVVSPREGTRAVTPRELTREISDAVQAGDIARLAEYANMSSVSLYTDRSAIQILSCDGETIAGHIPVHRDLLTAMESETMELLDPEA